MPTDPTHAARYDPSRRAFLLTAAAGAISGGTVLGQPAPATDSPAQAGATPPGDVSPASLAALRSTLEATARDWILADKLVRPDGYVYTVDWAQFFIYFAGSGDADTYLRMREHAVRKLIVDDPKDELTRGFVQWRFKAGEPPDTSGTTEMLRVAKGLWLGSVAFNRPADADLAVLILRGYARHAVVDQGIWLIRNYFSLIKRQFATNSFLVDYDPDFIAEVARARDDKELTVLADNCYGVYRQAVAPSGLIYDLVQPEIKTLVGRKDVVFFSPNDIMGLHNSLTCAAGVARGLPPLAKGVLAFAMSRLTGLRSFYFGRTGEPVDDTPVGIVELSSLVRLAMLSGGAIARQQLLKWVVPRWQTFVRAANLDAYTVSELLLALQAVAAQPTSAGAAGAK